MFPAGQSGATDSPWLAYFFGAFAGLAGSALALAFALALAEARGMAPAEALALALALVVEDEASGTTFRDPLQATKETMRAASSTRRLAPPASSSGNNMGQR
jgi:hypothetical protein